MIVRTIDYWTVKARAFNGRDAWGWFDILLVVGLRLSPAEAALTAIGVRMTIMRLRALVPGSI